MFIIIVFRSGSDKLAFLAWGRVDDYSFSIAHAHFVFC